MLFKTIASYYHYFWLLLAAVVGLKVLLSFIFNSHLEGFQGLLYSIFKWYGEDDQQMEDLSSKKTQMRMLNILSFAMYLILFFIILFSLVPMFIPV